MHYAAKEAAPGDCAANKVNIPNYAKGVQKPTHILRFSQDPGNGRGDVNITLTPASPISLAKR